MAVSPPCPLSGGLSSREGAFLGYLVVWGWKAHIQEEEFAEEEGVVDPFFDFVITQAVSGLKQ